MTSWRTSFSLAFASSKLISSAWAFNSSICSSVIGRPSSFSVSANAIHNFLHVRNFFSGEKMYCISLLAYRSESGLWYLSFMTKSSFLIQCFCSSIYFHEFSANYGVLWNIKIPLVISHNFRGYLLPADPPDTLRRSRPYRSEVRLPFLLSGPSLSKPGNLLRSPCRSHRRYDCGR